MTPKEKALELYNKYAKILHFIHDVRSEYNEYAKECALIAVDYMDEACGSALSAMGFSDEMIKEISIEYLENVKKEINLL